MLDSKLLLPAFGIQATGGSTSVRAFWTPLRNAGASARAMLVQAAAQQWQVEPASCTTSNGDVTHTETDFTIPNLGTPLQMMRTYDSSNTVASGTPWSDRGMGDGWSSRTSSATGCDAIGTNRGV